MSQERAAVMVEHQARGCAELGSPLYAFLLERVARDVREGGPCAQALAGYGDAPGPDAVALRLLGGVHALALTGRAPDLAACYPSTGGVFDPDRPEPCWRAFRAAVATGMEWVRDWMTRPPQTNEAGRANLLVAGLLRASQTWPLPVRLLELGSSAGLNLRADRFRYVSEGFAWGPAGSPVLLEDVWRGAPPAWLVAAAARWPALTVVERRGCDVTPIDPLSSGGALALRAYVWPDQTARAARLEGALRLAERVPAGSTPSARPTSWRVSGRSRARSPWSGTRSCASTSRPPSGRGWSANWTGSRRPPRRRRASPMSPSSRAGSASGTASGWPYGSAARLRRSWRRRLRTASRPARSPPPDSSPRAVRGTGAADHR